MADTITPGKWKATTIHEMEVEAGTVTQLDNLSHYGVHAVFNDEKLRRCTVIVADCHITAGREHEAKRNALLFAAAPDLLEVVQDWLWYAGGALSEFDLDGDEPCAGEEPLCPRCREVGCIQAKIKRAKNAVMKSGHKIQAPKFVR